MQVQTIFRMVNSKNIMQEAKNMDGYKDQRKRIKGNCIIKKLFLQTILTPEVETQHSIAKQLLHKPSY